MCELTHADGNFWRDIFKRHSEPTTFQGFTFWRRHDEQELIDRQAKRLADTALRELRALEASDKEVFAAFGDVQWEIEYRHPHLRAALADAYRAGDHAEIGRIVAKKIRLVLQAKAEDAADESWSEVERDELRELNREKSA